MRKKGEARKNQSRGKLAANCEGPFRILEDLMSGAYLECLNENAIPNTWNATHLKFYFS